MFVLMAQMQYESRTFLGLFATPEDARAEATKMINDPVQSYVWYDWYEIYHCQVGQTITPHDRPICIIDANSNSHK